METRMSAMLFKAREDHRALVFHLAEPRCEIAFVAAEGY
jgi:hypothetical protein